MKTTKIDDLYVRKARMMGQTEVMVRGIFQNNLNLTQKDIQIVKDSQEINPILMKNRIPRDTMINWGKHDQSRKSQHKIIIPTKSGDEVTWS